MYVRNVMYMYIEVHNVEIVGAMALTGAASFGPGSGPVFIETLSCTGNELSVLECREVSMRRQLCTHARDVSVRCIGKTKLGIN